MLTTIDTDTTQLFAGANLTQDDSPECTGCTRTLREGEQVTIYAARKEDAPTFRIERIYCRDCTPEELTAPTLGLSEYLFQSRLTRTLDVQTQSEFYTLHDPDLIATSARARARPKPTPKTYPKTPRHSSETHNLRPPNAPSIIWITARASPCATAEVRPSTRRSHSLRPRHAPPDAVRTARSSTRAARRPGPAPTARARSSRAHGPNTSGRVRVIRLTPLRRPIPTATRRSPILTPSRRRVRRHARAFGL